MSARSARRRGPRAMLAQERAFAAVEFALMLPLVLVIYLGLAELALGQRASQKLDLVAHTLSDLAAQQLTGGSNSGQAGMDETTIQAIFSAATTLMSPLPTDQSQNDDLGGHDLRRCDADQRLQGECELDHRQEFRHAAALQDQ